MFKRTAVAAFGLLLTAAPFLALTAHASAASLVNPIANPQLATAAVAGTPDGWSPQTWTSVAGSITPSFEYITNDGHGDNTSVKVTMANYDTTYVPGADGGTQGGALTGDDGDAKWVFNPIPVSTTATDGTTLQAGKEYRFTAWYKGSVAPKVVADYLSASGTETFFGMPNPLTASTTEWTQYSESFTIPQNTAQVTVFMFLDKNGWVQSDDYSITDYTPSGFSEPLLSLTYDDGSEDNVATLIPLLGQYGYKTTQCFETGTLIANPTQAQTNLGAFLNAGHEICSHTITHPMLTQVSATQLAQELVDSKSYLQNLVGSAQQITDFASPYGDYNQQVIDAIKAAGYASHRSVDEGFNSKDNFNAYRLRVQNIFPTTTASQVSAWVAQAQADKTWLILVYHRVVDTTKAGQAGYEAPGPYDVSKDTMAAHLQAISASGIKVVTMAQGLQEAEAQLGGVVPPPVTPPVTTPKVGDLTNDGKVNDDDATIMFANWGSAPKAGDLDHNGVVNDDDATLLFANWSK